MSWGQDWEGASLSKKSPIFIGGWEQFSDHKLFDKAISQSCNMWVNVSAYSEDWSSGFRPMNILIWKPIILPTEWEPFTMSNLRGPQKIHLPLLTLSDTTECFFILESEMYFPIGIHHLPLWEPLKSSRSIWGKKKKKIPILFCFCAIKEELFFLWRALDFWWNLIHWDGLLDEL